MYGKNMMGKYALTLASYDGKEHFIAIFPENRWGRTQFPDTFNHMDAGRMTHFIMGKNAFPDTFHHMDAIVWV